METTIETIDNVTVIVRLGERLDARNAREFKRSMVSKLAYHSNVIFDMSELKSVDSSGLGAILFCLRRIHAWGGDLKLCGMVLPVRALFELVRMHRILDLYNTREEAIIAFRQ